MDDKDLENTRALNDLSDLLKQEDEKIIDNPNMQTKEILLQIDE